MRAVPILAVLALLAALPVAGLAQTSIKDTKHNLSALKATGVANPNDVRAATESQICVFCHTPHGASTGAKPLWNRTIDANTTYTMYQSMSMDAHAQGAPPSGPDGPSRICLSCHDGTIALGSINVLNGAAATVTMQGGVTTMPADTHKVDSTSMGAGVGQHTGFTRLIGRDLSNDHPISINYETARTNDLELRAPNTATAAERTTGQAQKPKLPLQDGKVHCTSCHDPHVTADKFLRLRRLQGSLPVSNSAFDPDRDQICLACHEKKGWAESAHAVSSAQYTDAGAKLRQFPAGTTVAQAGCLNCHDTHTVPGAPRLLREGIVGASTASSLGARVGDTAGNKQSAIENTCFQCHSSNPVVTMPGTGQLNVGKDFSLTYRMPITKQPEKDGHDIGNMAGFSGVDSKGAGADFLVGPDLLAKRHAECTSCHNPHRVRTGASGARGTHSHTATHTNLVSGTLYGTWGVEPTYGSITSNTGSGTTGTKFPAVTFSTTNNIKRGMPTTTPTDLVKGTEYNPLLDAGVTREYQICMKCHSNFGWGVGGAPALPLTDSGGLTGKGTSVSNASSYTNQAQEFYAPGADAVGGSGNRRSWHPVMRPTGRTLSARGITSTNPWLAPFTAVGDQTMYCTDCHGSSNGSATNTTPSSGNAWGPHGSTNAFILKGAWTLSTGEGSSDDQLCFKCHTRTVYASTSNSGRRSGFWNSDRGNLHNYHANKIDSAMRCRYCHVAIPHGWHNRALIANISDVGANSGPVNVAPYYRGSYVRVTSWSAGGSWVESNCNGGEDGMRNQCENP